MLRSPRTTSTRLPGGISNFRNPSITTCAGNDADRDSTATSDRGLTTNGFVNNACALFGTTKIASNSGHNTGPPAENAYAVEPVGVEIITPSHPNELTGRPSTSKIASNTPERF
jgi:hypothetical protein